VNEAVFSDHSMLTPAAVFAQNWLENGPKVIGGLLKPRWKLNELKKVQGPEKTSKSYL